MEWLDVGKIALAAIISAGGIGGIIIGVIHFSANQIADRLSKKYEAKLSQELEKYKSELSKKKYVSKTRFDAEFEIYRELSRAFFDLVKDINGLIPSGLHHKPAEREDAERQANEILQKSFDASLQAQDALNKNAPFIPAEFYDAFNNILRLCFMQIDVIREKNNVLNFDPQKGIPQREDYRRTDEINKELKETNQRIRDYLASLDVAE